MTPRVSCLMPTGADRQRFIDLSLRWFRSQTWPNKELLIVDDGDIPAVIPDEPNLRHLRLSQKHTTGYKLNVAAREATGEILACWDDDDYFSPKRLEKQASWLLSGNAEVTLIQSGPMLTLPDGKWWNITRPWLTGGDGTLALRRELLTDAVQFPDLTVVEKSALLMNLLAAYGLGCRIQLLPNEDDYVYVRHPGTCFYVDPASIGDPVLAPKQSYRDIAALYGSAPPKQALPLTPERRTAPRLEPRLLTEFGPWREKLLQVVRAINRRSSNRYPAERIVAQMEHDSRTDPHNHMVFVVLDVDQLLAGTPMTDAVAGMLGLDVCKDNLGVEFACLTLGWIAPGYRSAPFDLGLPIVEAWARQRGLARIVSFSERSEKSYAAWIGARGFRRREVCYEKDLIL